MMNNDIQTFLKKAGDSACYVLCLLDVAFSDNRPFDLVYCLQTIVNKGWVRSDFYVLRPDLILQEFTGCKWEVFKAGADYVPARNEYEIDYYERGSIGHFDRPNFHPIVNSRTVKEGRLASKRICRKVV